MTRRFKKQKMMDSIYLEYSSITLERTARETGARATLLEAKKELERLEGNPKVIKMIETWMASYNEAWCEFALPE